MTPEQMERAIEFLLNSQAQNAADIGKLTADIQGLKELQAKTSNDIAVLVEAQAKTSNDIAVLVEAQTKTSNDIVALVEAQTKTSNDIAVLVEAQTKTSNDIVALAEAQAQTSNDIVALAEAQMKTNQDVQTLTSVVVNLVDAVSRQEDQAESDRAEIREAINNLIIANEVTRKLSEDVARLAVATNQRVSNIEQRVTDLESK